MRNLVAFLIKNSAWFVFVFLEIVCFYFIFNYNSFQRSIYLNSSNEIVGRVYAVSGEVLSYFGLKEANQDLLVKNAELQNRVLYLEDYIHKLSTDSLKTEAVLQDSLSTKHYDFIVGRVINNSIAQIENYITINKGSNNGLRTDMGIISQQGIVGIIRAVSENYSVVQPIINPKTALSCKVKGSNTPGTLTWDGQDYRYANLVGFPRFERFEKGDTIITSGYSGIFPEGIMVGIVEDSKGQSDDNFLTLKIRLSTDFSSLKDILIINNENRDELLKLEKEISENDK
ncbi:rod shape-determining protein MreC [Dysgonomonas macrotermitis]|uniref:Cell shape-determining protein MreC n=1 Tax=Dysgonomonas macrotermitis TaxID=1346286 RepID=A0A1M5AMQ3_9BACT|nr:rod shape-determining protein MreC [Dysgonomonas macrotermitis]SHF31414.1 rod shape-determining protein MreC [Dysgonomonas macrotermitis]